MIDTAKYRDDELVTLREAAAILNVSDSTVTRYREDGKFPYYKFSKRNIKYCVKDLREFRNKSFVPACEYLE